MQPYLTLIKQQAEEANVSLLAAFKSAEIKTSTYYRSINGETELRFDTANKVSHAIAHLHSLEEARKNTKELRSSNQRVNRRKIRAAIKSRVPS